MVVPGLGFDGDSLETKALGGSETAAIYMARGLARLGHKVTVFATTNRPGIYHGVNYLPFERWDQAITHVPHDISILQRMLDAFAVPRAGKLNILWCHDLLTAEFAARLSAALPNTHGVFVVSDYMAEHYRAMARFRDGQLFVKIGRAHV